VSDLLIAEDLYRAMCDYLKHCGWQRIEPGSGWWIRAGAEYTLGEAVEEQITADGVDTREEPVRG
jgi:hypothetical protein